MIYRRFLSLVSVVGAAWVASACGGSESDDDAGACQAWREAYCRYAERCGDDVDECRTVTADLKCGASSMVADCPSALDATTSCDQLPHDCAIQNVADRSAAEAACTELVDQGCAFFVRCGNDATEAACVERLRSNGLDCSLAIGTTSEYPTCRDQLAKASCDSGLPASCGDAIHLLDP